jgi:hypothetical protein
MLAYYLKLCHDSFLLNPFQFIVSYHPITRRYLVWITERVQTNCKIYFDQSRVLQMLSLISCIIVSIKNTDSRIYTSGAGNFRNSSQTIIWRERRTKRESSLGTWPWIPPFLHRVQPKSVAYPTFYTMSAECSFLGTKPAAASSLPFTSL